jgi:hypothetical protein
MGEITHFKRKLLFIKLIDTGDVTTLEISHDENCS